MASFKSNAERFALEGQTTGKGIVSACSVEGGEAAAVWVCADGVGVLAIGSQDQHLPTWREKLAFIRVIHCLKWVVAWELMFGS